MEKVKIIQIKSAIKRSKKQRLTLQSLGLGKLHKSIEVELTPPVRGMVAKVNHLVSVTKL